MGKFDNLKFTKYETSPTWDFRNDPEITGILRNVEENVGVNNSMLYTLETEDGLISVWGSTILDNRLKNAEIGEVIKIKYLGKEQSEKRKGASYHNFEVYHAKLIDLEKEVDKKSKKQNEIDYDEIDDILKA